MAKARKATKKTSGGRGSAEAIEKRKVARHLNSLLTDGVRDARLDGRTEKRRQRLITELKEGRRGKPLKPIDFLQSVHDLLEIGETIASLKKQGVKARKTELNDEVMETVERTQAAYNFRPEAWKLLGVTLDAKKARKNPKNARKKR